MPNYEKMRANSLDLIVDQYLRDLPFCSDPDTVLNYAAMAAKMSREDFLRVVKRKTTSAQ